MKNTKTTKIKHWIMGAIIVMGFAALAGWYGKAQAQEITGTVLIGDDIYTVVEIGETTILMGD